jgi:two-component system, sensor histidine kinase LadS
MKQKYIFTFIIWSSICVSIKAQTVLLNDSNPVILVSAHHIHILEDSTHQLTLQKILQSDINSRFHKSSKSTAFLEDTRQTYWLRIDLKYPQSTSERWLLEILDSHIGFVEAYIKIGKEVKVIQKMGYQESFNQRIYQHKNFLYKIPLVKPHEKFSIYFKIKSDNHNAFIFKLWQDQYFMQYALREYYMLGIYYGVLVIMALYNMMLYFYVKEKFYLYYVFYVLSCVLISFSEDGLGFQFIWYSFPFINTLIDRLIHFVFLFFFTLYARNFLDFKTNLPTVYLILTYILLGYAVYFLAGFIFPIFDPGHFVYVLVVPFSLIYGAATYMYFKGIQSYNRFFLLGYSFTMIGIITVILRKNGVSSDSIIYVYSLYIGLMVEIVFFSLAQAYRLRIIKLEKEQAQEKLIKQLQENEKVITKKVIERTHEIAEKNRLIEEKNIELEAQAEMLKEQAEEITQMNQILNEENIQLQGSVKELTKARVMMQDVDFSEFTKIFADEDACYKYLADLKWTTDFKCTKCENTKYTEGQGHYARRCTKCTYNESCTVNTIFHRNHIPIQKALYMLFLVYANKGDITNVELSEILSIRRSTCGKFSNKIKERMKMLKSQPNPQNLDGWSQLILM